MNARRPPSAQRAPNAPSSPHPLCALAPYFPPKQKRLLRISREAFSVGRGNRASAALISRTSYALAGIGTFADAPKRDRRLPGIKGPVPPPLWIRATPIQLLWNFAPRRAPPFALAVKCRMAAVALSRARARRKVRRALRRRVVASRYSISRTARLASRQKAIAAIVSVVTVATDRYVHRFWSGSNAAANLLR